MVQKMLAGGRKNDNSGELVVDLITISFCAIENRKEPPNGWRRPPEPEDPEDELTDHIKQEALLTRKSGQPDDRSPP